MQRPYIYVPILKKDSDNEVPNQQKKIPIETEPKALRKKSPCEPFCKSFKESSEKLEKVVNPPNSPTVMARERGVGLVQRALHAPMQKQPMMLQQKTPMGNWGKKEKRALERTQRSNAPHPPAKNI